MLRELAVFALLYAMALGGYAIMSRWSKYQDDKEDKQATSDSLSPLDPFISIAGRRHFIATARAATLHPSTLEAGKHYVIHFLIYSGYVVSH